MQISEAPDHAQPLLILLHQGRCPADEIVHCLTADPCQAKNLDFFNLSDYAARRSGTRGEIREGDFSDGIKGAWAVSRHKLLSEKYCIGNIFQSSDHVEAHLR